MSTDEKLAALRAEFVAAKARWWDHWLANGVESPIERLLLAQMLVDGWEVDSPHMTLHSAIGELADAGLGNQSMWFLMSDTSPCLCALQATIPGPERYRVDFAFIGRRMEAGRDDMPIVRVAVELDGHDFHERTKEQASRDKRRDRIFASNGWTVLRFTGSDVYRDPAAVLSEIERVCVRLCWPHMNLEEPK
jgi:very-short-patch-repair endonuclease